MGVDDPYNGCEPPCDLDVCPGCGMRYAGFRTGYTYPEVYALMWVATSDAATWRYKRRASVLGRWRQLKLAMWAEHCEKCAL